jgi:dihydrofolate reductase
MPRKIVVTQYVSLDGVMEDPVGIESSGLGNWTGPFKRGAVGDQFKLDELFAADSMIYGRVTYTGFAMVWPQVKDDTGFAERMNTLPKFVASKTLREPTWSNSTIWRGDLVDEVAAFKEQGDGETLIYGSISIVHQLAPAGLIDEYRLMVYPTVLGRGKPVFPPNVKQSLAFVESRQLGDGIMLLRFRAA